MQAALVEVTCSVEDARLISRNHILDIDESILTAMHFEELECSLDKVTEVDGLALAVVDFVTKIRVSRLEQVHDRQDLSIVRHKSLTDRVRAGHERLQNLQSDSDDIAVTGVQGSLDGDDQLRNNGQNLSATVLQHIKHTLDGKETVGIHFLANTLEEDRQVVMIIELLNLDLPLNLVLGTMLNSNWKISTVVEETELADGDLTSHNGTSPRLLNNRLFLRFEER